MSCLAGTPGSQPQSGSTKLPNLKGSCCFQALVSGPPCRPYLSPCHLSLGLTIPGLEALSSATLTSHGLMTLDALAAVVRALPHAVDLVTIEPKDVLKNDPQKLCEWTRGGRSWPPH